jgi:hypothetical protein
MKFRKGARAIGEIANIQNTLGQMLQIFEHMDTPEGRIKVHNLTDDVYFPEIGETMSLEKQLRIWLQAAVDNGKFLLLDKWDYSRPKLLSRIFYIEDANGNKQSINTVLDNEGKPIDSATKHIMGLTKMHRIPGHIRNGRKPDESYDLSSLQQESQDYLHYTKNRSSVVSALTGLPEGSILFNENIAPLEQIAITYAKMWFGDGLTLGRVEPGKLTPVQFIDSIYKKTHLESMRKMDEGIHAYMRSIMKEELSESDVNNAFSKGLDYATDMWLNEKNGFVKLLDQMDDDIGPASWDHNPDLIEWTNTWADKFAELTHLEQIAATFSFLKGFTQKDADGKTIRDNNRKVLPPFAPDPTESVLDYGLMKKYLGLYNNILMKVDAEVVDSDMRNITYQTTDSLIKKVCK